MNIYWLEQSSNDVPPENSWLSARERDCLTRLRFTKRRDDWRLGRWTGKRAVAAYCNRLDDLPSLAEIEILAAPSGAPEVSVRGQPAGIGISLSHREQTALCCVSPCENRFGCDVEIVEPRSAVFVEDYCTTGEKALVEQTPPEPRLLVVTLLWSAKESALKALREGLRLDTRSVLVTLCEADQQALLTWKQSSLSRSSLQCDGWHPFRVTCSDTQLFHGWWRVNGNLLRTIVSALPRCSPVQMTRSSAFS
jgi:4'-phosphopantetheinyl transferase